MVTSDSPEAEPGSPKRLLIIGTGSIGERHLRCFQATGRATVAAVEANAELGRTIAERYGCPWYASLEEALRSGIAYEAAVIATPAHTHIAVARQCLAAGLHLLIEKPLAVSLEGVDALLEEERASDKAIRVAYTLRSVPVIRRLKEKLESGVIGEPKQVTVTSGQNFPSFRPAYRTIYYADHAKGGGAIQDALTHQLHSTEWLVGPITNVFADAAHQVLDGVEVEDTVSLHARLANGALANFSLNQFQHPNESFIALHSGEGSLRAELHTQRVGTFLKGDSEWSWEAIEPEERDAAFIRQADAFLDATEGRPCYLSTLAEGVQTLRVNLAALESVRTRREVKL